MIERVLRPVRHPGLAVAELAPDAVAVPTRVTGVCLDSRAVLPGDLYVALPGAHVHGAEFAGEAVARGAVAVLTDAAGATLASATGVPVLVVADPRARMGELAADVYGRPSTALEVFGVTGTNGKTSTVFLLEASLSALGRRVATIGTIGFRIDGVEVRTPRGTITTPDAPDLQGMLGHMVEAGVDSVAMEVSSIGVDQHRVDGIGFDVAAFTMFGQDHLDYHGTLEAYFVAKSRLFLGGRTRVAVVNADDPWGRRLIDLVRADGHARVVTTGTADADYRLDEVVPAPDGSSRVTITTPGGEVRYKLSMLGAFNADNSLTALAMVGAAGADVAQAAAGIEHAYIPGRMQRVPLGPDQPHVVVDFAHTPQAVGAALAALPGGGRRLVVLGAGGDRETEKRPLMGAAAARGADVVIVTDDNPRSEPPEAIRGAVLEGARGAAGAQVVDGGDRRSAIALALSLAAPGDWVAILGKGHEKTQEIAGVHHPFDDVAVVLELAGRQR